MRARGRAGGLPGDRVVPAAAGHALGHELLLLTRVPHLSVCRFTSSVLFLLGPPGGCPPAVPPLPCRCWAGACTRVPAQGAPSLPAARLLFAGHILYNIWQPVVFVGVVACVCEIFGAQSNVADTGVASDTFGMCSFVLSLVVSVRLRIAYDRWQAAAAMPGAVAGGTPLPDPCSAIGHAWGALMPCPCCARSPAAGLRCGPTTASPATARPTWCGAQPHPCPACTKWGTSGAGQRCGRCVCAPTLGACPPCRPASTSC